MILSTLFDSLIQILSLLINVYIWAIIIHSLILLANPRVHHPIIALFNRFTMPLYAKIKRFTPTVYNNIDLAPLLVIITLKFIDLFILRLLSQVI